MDAPGFDAAVRRALARWPGVPAVYGWLRLDARGEWRLRARDGGQFGRIGNRALREFIGRNYAADARGAWFFQNGPQRVFCALERTPLVFRWDGRALADHCGMPAGALAGAWLDEAGTLVLATARGPGVLDDRDLVALESCLADEGGAPLEQAPRPGHAFLRLPGAAPVAIGAIAGASLAARFGFDPDPRA